MGNVNLVIKDVKGVMTGLSLETHTSFKKYATSLSREKTAEEVGKRVESYAKYYGKKVQAFSEIPPEGNLFLFDVKTSSWLSLSCGKLIKLETIVKNKEELSQKVAEKRSEVSDFLGKSYGIAGDTLLGVVGAVEMRLLRGKF